MSWSVLVAELWGMAQQAGPFATLLMFYLWWRAESERVKLRDERAEMLERVLTAINSAATAVRENTQALFLLERDHK